MAEEYVSAEAAKAGADPKWSGAGKVHDWRSYVPADVRQIWHTFTPEQLAVIVSWADDLASDEDWG